MISSQVEMEDIELIEMEDIELIKLYKKGERDFSYHIFYNGNIEFNNMFNRWFSNFSNENLTKIILNNSKLHRANLSGTNLSGATLNCANLSSAILIYADLSGANLSGADLTKANLSGAKLHHGRKVYYPFFVSTSLKDAILTEANLENANLREADLENANLIGANLRGTNLKGIKLENTDFSGADLTNACLDHTCLKGMIIDNNTKINQKYNLIWEITNKELENRNLSGQDLSRANLLGTTLTGADLTGATLTGTDLTGADLTDANLTGANLTKADLTGADLTDANLTGADLTGADLRRAKLQCANLRGANLKMSKIANANFAEANFCDIDLSQTHNKLTTVSTLKDAYYNDETKFPEGLHPTNVHKIAQKAAQKISQMIWSNYQDPQWIKELLNNKGELQKYPPSREKQQEFKEELIKKYGYKCLISRCEIKEIIEEAHIIPYSKIESHDVANGLLLRVDLHRLFDVQLIAIHPTTRKVLICEQIAKDYQYIRGITIESCLTGEDATKQQDALRYHCEQCTWIDKQLLE